MELDEEYIDKVKGYIEQKDTENVKALLTDLHPADIAELCNDLDPEDARFVYRLLDNETAADVLVEMDEDVRKEFLELLPSETIAKKFVDYMDTDDAVDLMRGLDEDKQEEVLSHIEDIEQAGDIVDLLKYDEDRHRGRTHGHGNGDRERELEYARVSEGNAHAGRAAGRNLLRLCHRRRRTPAGRLPAEEDDYLALGVEGEARDEEGPHLGACGHAHRRGGADHREIRPRGRAGGR